MKRLTLTKIARTAAVVAASSSMLTFGISTATIRSAGADPTIATARVGVGSDTIQDLFNAYNSVENGTAYAPLVSSPQTGSHAVASWDATPTGSCITPGSKLGGGQFDRPNGSGDGIAALSDAIDNTNWFQTRAGQTSCTGPTANGNVVGQIDFSRSSRGPKGVLGCTTGPLNCLQFIPFARDAVSYAFSGGGADPAFTPAELVSMYSSPTGTLVKGGITWHACITQSGSGTTSFWEGALGITDATATAASFNSGCDSGTAGTISSSTLEENGGNTFDTQAKAIHTNFGAANEAVIDFSVGSWIAQANSVASDRSATARADGIDLGSPVALCPCPPGSPKPYLGTPGSEAPNSAYYADGTFGRDLYVVIPLHSCGLLCGSSGIGIPEMKNLFITPGPRTVTDAATTAGSTTLSSTAAAFTTNDLNADVSGPGIPAGTTIVGIIPGTPTMATMSNAATATATGVTVTIQDHAVICQPAYQHDANLNGFASFPLPGHGDICGDFHNSTPTSSPDTGGRRSGLDS